MIKDGEKITDNAIHSFLMIGQSNMAGRGEFGEVPAIDNPLCYMLRMGRWQKMREPVNPDRPIFEGRFHSGISLAASFANELANHTETKVGLIPCADGGTTIDQWMPGEVLYDHAIMMTKLAMRSSSLAGIIWHQGESDCHSDDTLYAHKEKFINMITLLRKELGAEDIPLIIGELSENYAESYNIGERSICMNRFYREAANELPMCAVASSQGLELKPDGIHFNSAATREFGKRYFEAYLGLVSKNQ